MKRWNRMLLTAAAAVTFGIGGCCSSETPPPRLIPIGDAMRERAGEMKAAWEAFPIRGTVVTAVTRRFYRGRDESLFERLSALGVNRIYLELDDRDDLDDLIDSGRLAEIVRAAGEVQIGVELLLIQRRFMPERYGSVIERYYQGKSQPLTEAVERILRYNDEAAPEEQLAGVAVAASPHTFRRGDDHLPANLLYLWSEDRYGAGGDNDQLLHEWFRLLASVAEQTESRLPLTAAFPAFYRSRAAAGDLSIGSVTDFLGWSDRAWVIGSGTRPSQLLDSLLASLDDAATGEQRVLCGVELAAHLSEESGALRRRDWQDLLRSLKTLSERMRENRTAAGIVLDSWDRLEWLWEQE